MVWTDGYAKIQQAVNCKKIISLSYIIFDYPAIPVGEHNSLLTMLLVASKIIGLPTSKLSKMFDPAILSRLLLLPLLTLLTHSIRTFMFFCQYGYNGARTTKRFDTANACSPAI